MAKNDPLKRVRFIVSGDVQGVGFRAWTKKTADHIQIVGWVKNREDKTVEVVGEGEEAALAEFIRLCHKGPEIAWVEDIEVYWQDATDEFISFEVIY